MNETQKAMMRIRAVQRRATKDVLGRPSWHLDAVDEHGTFLTMTTKLGVGSSYACDLTHREGEVLCIHYHTTGTGRTVATHWEPGDFTQGFEARQEAARLRSALPQAALALDKPLRL